MATRSGTSAYSHNPVVVPTGYMYMRSTLVAYHSSNTRPTSNASHRQDQDRKSCLAPINHFTNETSLSSSPVAAVQPLTKVTTLSPAISETKTCQHTFLPTSARAGFGDLHPQTQKLY